jgi:hypothetical protein
MTHRRDKRGLVKAMGKITETELLLMTLNEGIF